MSASEHVERLPDEPGSVPAVLLFVHDLVRALTRRAERSDSGSRRRAAQRSRRRLPIDLTGYWVSVVTQDWRWRMVTPAKGDYESIPITLEAKKVGDAWDPAKDEAAGEQCKAYGAPAIMAVPTRLHITWQDDNTLKVETDAGMQTRLFHFGNWKPPERSASWQGESVAAWEGRRGRGAAAPTGGSLKVVTTNLRPGYLRKNGVPYSENAVLTEYWDLGIRTQRRSVDHDHQRGGRSQVPAHAVRHRAAVQEGSRWRKMGSHAVFGR